MQASLDLAESVAVTPVRRSWPMRTAQDTRVNVQDLELLSPSCERYYRPKASRSSVSLQLRTGFWGRRVCMRKMTGQSTGYIALAVRLALSSRCPDNSINRIIALTRLACTRILMRRR
jgi:hypothetical protein